MLILAIFDISGPEINLRLELKEVATSSSITIATAAAVVVVAAEGKK